MSALNNLFPSQPRMSLFVWSNWCYVAVLIVLFPEHFELLQQGKQALEAMENRELMPAVQYLKYGGGVEGLQHADVPIPTPKNGEMLVRIEATSLNPVDWKIQRGQLKPFLPSKFPYIPCSDVSGEVIRLGPDVKSFNIGDKVVSWLDLRHGGGLAKYAIAETKYTAKRPAEVSAAEAAGLPVAGLTALQSLQGSAGVSMDGSYKGNILVTAASGGVGSYAVQLAKLGGAHVVATCGARNVDLLKSLGADEVLDYKTPQGADFQSSTCSKFDVIIHCATGIPWSRFEPVLSSKGILVDITPKFNHIVKSVIKRLTLSKKKLIPFFLNPRAKELQFLIDMLQQGKIKTVVDSTHPMSKVDDAWRKSMEGHATGKVIVAD